MMIQTLTLAPGMVNPTMMQLQPDQTENASAFQIISFDFMLDQDLKPVLLEMNDLPNWSTDELIDSEIKRSLIYGAYRLLCLNVPRKEAYKVKHDQKMYEQLVKANKMKMVEKIQSFDAALVKDFTITEGEDNMPGAEYRRLKMLYRKILALEKQEEVMNQQLERELNEEKLLKYNDIIYKQKRRKDEPVEYELIYPYLTYKQEHWIKNQFNTVSKTLNKNKVVKNIRNYQQELQTTHYDVNGNEIKKPIKTDEEKEQIIFQNKVYEQVFIDMYEEPELRLYDIIDEHYPQTWRRDMRDIFIKQ